MRAWWSSSRVLGVTAVIAGLGLAAWPERYDNPSYRVLFHYLTARQAGIVWVVVGLVSIFAVGRLSICLLGSSLIGWGLGLAIAAWTYPRSGSPLGWVWFVGLGAAVLRTLVMSGPERMRS